MIREIAVHDAPAAARLSGELGYPVSTVVMEHRIQILAGLEDRIVYVACQADEIVGWIDVGIVRHLQADAYVAYDSFFTDPERGLVEVACWAHTRRHFHQALDNDAARMGSVLAYYWLRVSGWEGEKLQDREHNRKEARANEG